MAYKDLYRRQVALLLRVLPHVAAEPDFALKGGTAINLFYRNMPRLSVDIDLTYLPLSPRQQSLAAIDAGLNRIMKSVTATSSRIRVAPQTPRKGETAITKLFVSAHGVQIKIEVTPVLRGCVFETELRAVSPLVENTFGFAEMKVVSFADLYGGKIVAALDRQHPRDLFDIRDLLANEGIDDRLRSAFIVYLLSHNRPMHEVLSGKPKDISLEYERGFAGMTETPVSLDTLLEARAALIRTSVGEMPGDHRRFLLSFESGAPEWDLLGLGNVKNLPAIKWRQANLNSLDKMAREALVAKLKSVIG